SAPGGDAERASCRKAKPKASVSPDTLEFSTHTLKRTSDPQTVTLSNVGEPDSELSVEDVDLHVSTGTGAFKLVSDKCKGAALKVGESCAVSVNFTADHLGHYAGIVIFVDDDPDS